MMRGRLYKISHPQYRIPGETLSGRALDDEAQCCHPSIKSGQ